MQTLVCCVQVGLVDEVGGLVRAIDLAKELAGLSPKPDDTNVVRWPSR
jgi:ClpP class serine protease